MHINLRTKAAYSCSSSQRGVVSRTRFRPDEEPCCSGRTALAFVSTSRALTVLFVLPLEFAFSFGEPFVCSFFRQELLGNSCDIHYKDPAKYVSATSSGLGFKAEASTENGSHLQSASFSRPLPSEGMLQILTNDVGFTIVGPPFSDNSSKVVIQFSSLARVRTPVLKPPASLLSKILFQRRWDAIASNNKTIESFPSSLLMQPQNPNSIQNVLTIIAAYVSKQSIH